jgi:uncharacterized membrane protein YjjP (DUF1212 family)
MSKPKTYPPKAPLPYEELRDVIDLSLWAGQMLLHFGADSRRIEETVHRLGTGLGCDWMDILVSPNALVVTTTSAGEFRTKVRRVVGITVNMGIVDAINTLSRRVTHGELNRHEVRAELERISQMHSYYPRWLGILMVGLACGAFSRLFEGDLAVFGVTFGAACLAMFLRQELQKRYYNTVLVVVVTALCAGLVASLAGVFDWSAKPQVALASAVLLLVPGVPLINAAQDLIQGHIVTGLVRGVWGGIIALAIALGLLMAIQVSGVEGL